jgi:hypothetical protein
MCGHVGSSTSGATEPPWFRHSPQPSQRLDAPPLITVAWQGPGQQPAPWHPAPLLEQHDEYAVHVRVAYSPQLQVPFAMRSVWPAGHNAFVTTKHYVSLAFFVVL